MTSRKFIIAWFACCIWFICVLSGGFTAAGIAAYFCGGAEHGSLGAIQDKAHLGFWVFIILLAPSMLVGAVGGMAAIVLPIYCIFRIPMRRKGRPLRWLEAYLGAVTKMLQDEW